MLPKTILITNKTNILYLSGFSGSGYLVMRGEKGFLFTDSRYKILAERLIPKGFKIIDTTRPSLSKATKLMPRRYVGATSDGFENSWKAFLKKYRVKQLGIEGNYVTLRFFKQLKKLSGKTKLVDIKDELDKKRIIKRSDELKNIKQAQKITEKVFKTIKKSLKIGMTEKNLAWNIKVWAHNFGADRMAFHPIVAINQASACPHHQNSDRKLKRGDMILIDMGVRYREYCSDMTRMIFTKQPTDEQKKIYELVLKAQKTTIKKLRAGLSGRKVDSFARQIIKRAGYEKYFGHALGHGVGLDIHELPNLSRKYVEKIPAGSVTTVEPGIYLPGKFGVRIEDMVLVGKNGVTNLTKTPKAIQDCIVRLK